MKKLSKIFGGVLALSVAMTANAGVVEMELSTGGSGGSQELVFTAQTKKQAILKIIQPGLANLAADGVLEDGEFLRSGFAFGQANAGTAADSWENYEIDTVTPQDQVALLAEVCGGTAQGSADHISSATDSAAPAHLAANGVSIPLAGSCTVEHASPTKPVTAKARVAYEVIASGGSTIDLAVIVTDGVDASTDGIAPGATNATKSFSTTFAVNNIVSHDGTGTPDATADDLLGLGETLSHNDSGSFDIDIAFDTVGANAKAESRGSVILNAVVSN